MKVCLTCGRRFQSLDWICPACGWQPAVRRTWPVFAPALAAHTLGFDPDAFEQLARVEAGHFWFRARNRLITWALQAYFPLAQRFLEVGCGTGYVLAGVHAARPELEVSGSEVFDEGLAIARSRLPNSPLFQMDARRIPFDAEFDVVGAFDVLEHIDEDETVLQQMFQATRPGGGIVLTVPQHHFLWSVVDEHSFHRRRYEKRELVDKVERCGFQVIRTTSFVSALLPIVWLSRARQNRTTTPDPASELRVSGLLNSALEGVMAAERWLITSGVSLPAGTSLLLAATRPGAATA